MKSIEDIITILQKENNHEKTNKLEEIEIIKAAASQNILTSLTAGTIHYTKFLAQLTTRHQHDDSLKKDRYFNKRRATLKMRL